jgi:MAF protein
MGLPFDVRPAAVEETNHEGEGPQEMASRLSALKARAVASATSAGLVIAADTLVYLDGEVLGKPSSSREAAGMLHQLRARPHEVFSGVTLVDAQSGAERTRLVRTTVWMRDYTDAEIAAYVASGDPMDKAGAYAIQHRALSPVQRINGCYANVMGLPLCDLYCMLSHAGHTLEETPAAACDRFNQRTCDVAQNVLPMACDESPA